MSVWSRRLAFDRASSRSFDADGRLHVSLAPITREQVASYLGREIPDAGRFGLDLGETFQIWRPAPELMKAAASAAGLPILRRHVYSSAEEHPADDVIGATMGDAIWDPPYVRVSLVLWDGEAIADVESGAVEQISSGYVYTFDPSPGVFEGQPYSGVMRDIEFNHIIVCEKGRAGPDVMVHDQALPDLLEEIRFRNFRRRVFRRAPA